MKELFCLYILKCNDGSYYTGHTDEIEKCITEHMLGSTPSYTSTRLPIELVFMQDFNSRALRYTALQTALRTNGGNRYGA